MIDSIKNKFSKESWFKYIVQWQTSGTKIGEYCRQNNLDHNAFIYWRKKFINEQQKEKCKANPISFLHLIQSNQAQKQVTPNSALDITIVLENQVKILLPANLPQQDLFQIIKMIKGLS